MDVLKTADGVEVKRGDHVYNYYDCEWGYVGRISFDGWFEFRPEMADGRPSNFGKLLNGERIAIQKPAWAR